MAAANGEAYDVVGIGFGPSSLALAIALAERPDDLTCTFFDRSEIASWHRGMLLPGAKMQVAFLKDLATFRNPTSRFSFVAYLHETGRLAKFVNSNDFFPSRHDFHTYLDWAESRLIDWVQRGVTVTNVESTSDALRIEVRQDGEDQCVYARNVVISTGLVPRMPTGIGPDQHVWHSSEFLRRYQELPTPISRVAVVGGGQSAAEIVRHIYDDLPEVEIIAIVPSFGYSAADNTPFANQVFDPDAVDKYYSAPEEARSQLWNSHRNTNYSVVDDAVLRDLHLRAYEDELSGRGRLRFLSMTRVLAAERVGGGTRVRLHSLLTDSIDDLDVDALVCATGYDPMDPTDLLGPIDRYCARDEHGRYLVARNHRLLTSPKVTGHIYLQGGTEHTHGLSSSLLSNIAVRGGEIADAIAAAKQATVHSGGSTK